MQKEKFPQSGTKWKVEVLIHCRCGLRYWVFWLGWKYENAISQSRLTTKAWNRCSTKICGFKLLERFLAQQTPQSCSQITAFRHMKRIDGHTTIKGWEKSAWKSWNTVIELCRGNSEQQCVSLPLSTSAPSPAHTSHQLGSTAPSLFMSQGKHYGQL